MNFEKVTMRAISRWRLVCAAVLFCAIAAIASPAQTFTTLVDFDDTDGFLPYAPLVQGLDGNFYGTTPIGGTLGSGNVFNISSGGTLNSIYSFCQLVDCEDGEFPDTGLALSANGVFYGTTSEGGVIHVGSIFKITPEGALTPLHLFTGPDGTGPSALVQGPDGNFYGTTGGGGANSEHCGGGCGTVFQITPKGTLTTIYNFCSLPSCADGSYPDAALIQGTDGNFYGTTVHGGTISSCDGVGCGTIFKITPSGQLTTLHRFTGKDGYFPAAPLVLSAGNLYGTTTEASGYGTAFSLSSAGKLTTLYQFCSQTNCTDGRGSVWLTLGTDGNLYGTTSGGGSGSGCTGDLYGCGTIFQLTPGGALTTLHNFCASGSCTDGSVPLAGLVQGTDGVFYGTTEQGGILTCSDYPGCGTVFSLAVGLGPFVSLQRVSGAVGSSGDLLGQGFTGTTGVFLNGTPASFTVVSDTYIEATVPAGATTGYVTVDTPSGTLKSNVVFSVIP
jgi:uncharacterized repeat protein (TIGR03803 family)